MTTAEDGRYLRTCPLCEAMCGLEIHVEGERVTSIRGNQDDVWSRGHLCPKGASLAALHHDPDRIRRPRIKVDGRWQEVGWDHAFRRCTQLLAPVIDRYGIGAVTAYTGNPLAHSFSLGRYAGVLLGMSGMPITYSPGTVDQWPKNGKPGTRLSVANSAPGANTNVLSLPTFVDEPSGNGALNGIPVTLIDDRARFRSDPLTGGRAAVDQPRA